MVKFLNAFVHLQQNGGKDQNDGGHAQYHALGHNDADIPAQGQPHKAQGQKAGHGGKGGAGDRFESGHHGRGHGVPFILIMGQLFHIPVKEEDGVVHGDSQLEHGGHRLGDKGDLAQEDVGAEVVDHGQPDGQQKGHRQKPGIHHDTHGDGGENNGHEDV